MIYNFKKIFDTLRSGLPSGFTQRDIKAYHLTEQLYYAVQEFNANRYDDEDPYEYVPYFYYDDLYFKPGNRVVITLEQQGKLFCADVLVAEDGTVSISNVMPATMEVAPVSRSLFLREGGERLVLSISSSATLLRNHYPEIDSRDLFDSFIERFESGQKVLRNIAHLPESDVGEVVWLAREGNLLLSATRFYDTDLGLAAFEAVRADPGYWGDSIEFFCLNSESEQSGLVVNRDGILTRISSLPESVAAAENTKVVLSGEQRMKSYQLEALQKIAEQDPSAVDALIEQARSVNEEIEESGAITRSEELQTPQAEELDLDLSELFQRVNDLTVRSDEQDKEIAALKEELRIANERADRPHDRPHGRSFSLVPFAEAVGPTQSQEVQKPKGYTGSKIGRKLGGRND